MSKAARIALVAAGVALACLATAWALRFRIAEGIVARRLAGAGVPARYRLDRLDPFVQRLRDVAIGPAGAPDLTAREVELRLGYGPAGPYVAGVTARGVRVKALIDADGLHMGSLDRLLPKSGGKPTLPDLALSLDDVGAAIATPNGLIRATIAGEGNPARRFAGRVAARSDAVRLADCRVDRPVATLAIDIAARRPSVAGTVSGEAVRCPRIALGRGRLRLAAGSDEAFARLTLRAEPTGFAGRAGPARFAGVSGRVVAAGALGALDGRAALRLAGLSLPDLADRIAAQRTVAAGTPVAATVRRAADAVAALVRRGEMAATGRFAIRGRATTVALDQATIADGDGGRMRLAAARGLGWSPAGWRIDGDLHSGGGALPTLDLHFAQFARGAALAVTGRLAPYAAGASRLGAERIAVRWAGGALAASGRVRVDGPLAGGFVHGLEAPLAGGIEADGRVRIAPGCTPVAVDGLRLASFMFGPTQFPMCGDPIVARAAAGRWRLAARIAAASLAGRTGVGAPVSVRAVGIDLSTHGFVAHDVAMRLGQDGVGTRLDLARLDGDFGNGVAGRFEGAAGAIANVPLVISEGDGGWSLKSGALAVDGALQVADAAGQPRFLPLAARGVRLALAGNRIVATGSLREPMAQAEVMQVAIDHDLGTGTGHARLNVPGIAFTPKGLQPERLTPLTLGVVANVAGTIAGEGTIDWSPRGTTSRGAFRTEGLDLAAAFGPVKGIRGTLVFTDLLGLVSAPDQEATIAEINPGLPVSDGRVRYALLPGNRVAVASATWPFAGGTLRLEPTTLDFAAQAVRRLTFRIERLDAAAFVQQLDFPNIAATGTFDGTLPMVFDAAGGRIEQGAIAARPGGGTIAYVGELSRERIGTMGKLAFDALKAIRYSSLDIALDGRLDGEMVSRVRFAGVRQATAERGLVARMIRNLPFRFNIAIRAPFRSLAGSARAYLDPRLLLRDARPEPAVQPPASAPVR